MRFAGLSAIGALGLIAAASANAAPAVPDAAGHAANVIQVADGCGFGWHANYWGDCVPNRFRFYRHRPNYIIEEWDEYY